MIIANPIYDTVFKYLMSNLSIAKGIISTIIDEEIIHLDFKSQENVYKSASLTVYHLDFIARIKTRDSKYKNVLIEMQKSNIGTDIMRFRRYLGEQYKKEDEIISADGTITRDSLPILTIYFLGFKISKKLPPVVKIARKYIDVLHNKEISERNDFIEKLTHNSYVIQIPGLHVSLRNRLEQILSIFQQEKFIGNEHYLKNYSYEIQDDLIQDILRQLEKAAADNELLKQLELEEQAARELEAAIGKIEKKLEVKDKELEESQKALEVKDKALEVKDKELEEKERLINELRAKLDDA